MKLITVYCTILYHFNVYNLYNENNSKLWFANIATQCFQLSKLGLLIMHSSVHINMQYLNYDIRSIVHVVYAVYTGNNDHNHIKYTNLIIYAINKHPYIPPFV